MSHVAGEEVELTEATSAVETQWRRQNGRRTTASFTARAQSEREGEGARLGAQLSEGGRVWVGGLQKRLGRVGCGRGMRDRGHVYGEEISRFGGQFRQAGPTE
jgi:hypothetical protein